MSKAAVLRTCAIMLNVNQSTGARRDGLGRVVTVCPVMRGKWLMPSETWRELQMQVWTRVFGSCYGEAADVGEVKTHGYEACVIVILWRGGRDQ